MGTVAPVFNFEGHNVRVVLLNNDEPWFVAKDVADALGLQTEGTGAYHRTLDRDEKHLLKKQGAISTSLPLFRGTTPSLMLISESGLYKLIMRAHPNANPAVARFQNWVTREVLPAIRKDGMYVMGEEKVKSGELSEDEFILKAMTILKSKAERLTQELAVATTQKEHLAGIVEEHLVHLTIDEWRALNGQYFTKSTTHKLAMALRKRLLVLGLEVPYEARTFVLYVG